MHNQKHYCSRCFSVTSESRGFESSAAVRPEDSTGQDRTLGSPAPPPPPAPPFALRTLTPECKGKTPPPAISPSGKKFMYLHDILDVDIFSLRNLSRISVLYVHLNSMTKILFVKTCEILPGPVHFWMSVEKRKT